MTRAWLAVLVLAACTPSPAPRTHEAARAAPSGTAPVASASASAPVTEVPTAVEPPPDVAREPRIQIELLEVPGFEPAVLVIPDVATPLPLIVAAHGAGDTPEAQCEVWSELARGRAVVLCPRGVALRRGADAYFYRNHHELEREFLAALAALRQRLGARLDDGPALYAGYSQGATMGALMIGKHAGTFRRLVLIEGGFDAWSLSRSRDFQKAGGERVLLVCGTGHCRKRARTSVAALTRAGVQARLEHVEGGGHAYWGRVAERVAETLDWVVAGGSESG